MGYLRKKLLAEFESNEISEKVSELKRVRFTYSKIMYQKSRKQTIRAIKVLMQTRGLTRCLANNFLSTKISDPPNFFVCGRLTLMRTFLVNWRLFHSEILTCIYFSHQFEVQDKNIVGQENFLSAEFSTRLVIDQNYEFIMNRKNDVVYADVIEKIVLSKSSFLISLLIWNLSNVRQIMFILGIEREFNAFLSDKNPELYRYFLRFRVLNIVYTQNSSQTFDELAVGFPNQYSEIINLEIWHGRLFIKDSNLLISDITCSPKQKFVAGYWAYVSAIKHTDRSEVRSPSESQLTIPTGILLIGRVDTNWFHFLLDTLPRMLFVSSIPERVPILVRDDIPDSGKTILSTLTSRKVIYVRENQNVRVSKAYLVSARGAIFDTAPRVKALRLKYSINTYQAIAELIQAKTPSLVGQDDSPRIAFFRNSSVRAVQNQSEIALMLRDRHFAIFSDGNHFFENQVRIYTNASIFVGAGGAAVANIIFMQKGTKVVILQNRKSKKLGLWSELACGLGLHFESVEGKALDLTSYLFKPLHAGFTVDVNHFRRALIRNLP